MRLVTPSPPELAKRTNKRLLGSHRGLLARFGHTTRLTQRTPQHKVKLSVHTAQIVICPTPQGIEHLRIGAQQECFSFAHDNFSLGRALRVERSRIHHRLRVSIATQDHEQVGHHRRLALFIEFHDAIALEVV